MPLRWLGYWAVGGALLLGCGGSGSLEGAGGDGGLGLDGASGGSGEGGTNGAPFDCDADQPANCPQVPPDTLDDERPAVVSAPADYSPDNRYPLVIVLHAKGSSGSANSLYLGATQRVDSRQFILVTPDGTPDIDGDLGWNAGAIVLEFAGAPPDDRAYVRRLIGEAKQAFRIDDTRIYLMGSSNGGHLALDLLCEDPSVATAAINQAGALPMDAPCVPGVTSLLSVHGTEDEAVAFGGGIHDNGITIYSAVALLGTFAENGGCGPVENASSIDLVEGLPGAETRVQRYTGCDGGAEHALWAVQQGSHAPPFTEDARERWFDWLFARARLEN